MEKDNNWGDNQYCWVSRNPTRLKKISNIFSWEIPILNNISEMDMMNIDEEVNSDWCIYIGLLNF